MPRSIADVWAIYYPGLTPEQAYEQHRRRHEERGALNAEVSRLCWDVHPETLEQEKELRARMVEALTAVSLHDGAPRKWISKSGHIEAPDDTCRECWKPGAVADDAERGDGNTGGYHAECARAMIIRCDLRIAAYARMTGDEERARVWEQRAAAAHPAGLGGPDSAEAAWIRVHAWNDVMRWNSQHAPELFAMCVCQAGPSPFCVASKHQECHRATPVPQWETVIVRPDGRTAHFRDTYAHPTVSQYGTWRSYAAMVWLADRLCRWVCPCDCHDGPPEHLQLAFDLEVRA